MNRHKAISARALERYAFPTFSIYLINDGRSKSGSLSGTLTAGEEDINVGR
jgi:hypothetical protein